MNDLDLAIVATLRAEAREAEMRTDTPRQYELLTSRLDDVDRSRTRTRWLAVAAAVLVAGGLAWAVSGAQQAQTLPPATTPSVSPSAGAGPDGMRYYAVDMDPDMRLTLPAWTTGADIDWNSPQGSLYIQDRCGEPLGVPACSADGDVKLRLESLVAYYPASGGADPVVGPSYADFLGQLDALVRRGAVSVSDRSETQVGGRPATLLTLAGLRNVPGVLGCPKPTASAEACFPIVAGRDLRLAVVDHGASKPPTLMYVSLNKDAADMAERFAELDAMLSTVEFG
jgi:hypothetical protein